MHLRPTRNDFKARVFLGGDFFVWDVHQDRQGLIDGLFMDICLYSSDEGSALTA